MKDCQLPRLITMITGGYIAIISRDIMIHIPVALIVRTIMRPRPTTCKHWGLYRSSVMSPKSFNRHKFLKTVHLLRFAAAENKKKMVLGNGCEIDSSRVCVAVTLPGLVPSLSSIQLIHQERGIQLGPRHGFEGNGKGFTQFHES